MNRPLTIFCDLDGTLVEHKGSLAKCIDCPLENRLLPGVEDFLQFVYAGGHKLIVTTGRPEMLRDITVHQCEALGIYYDQLIMGCTPGLRLVINDLKSDGSLTAGHLNPPRNQGFSYEDIQTLKGL